MSQAWDGHARSTSTRQTFNYLSKGRNVSARCQAMSPNRLGSKKLRN